MCPQNISNPSCPRRLIRRRTIEEMMLSDIVDGVVDVKGTSNSMGTSSQSNNAKSRDGGSRSLLSTLVLVIASLSLAINSTFKHQQRESNLKDLSETVSALAHELQTLSEVNAQKDQSFEALQKELMDERIELAWEEQHLRDTQELKYEKQLDVIQREEYILQDQNAHLKESLEHALDELALAKKEAEASKRPPTNPSSSAGSSSANNNTFTTNKNKVPVPPPQKGTVNVRGKALGKPKDGIHYGTTIKIGRNVRTRKVKKDLGDKVQPCGSDCTLERLRHRNHFAAPGSNR